MDIQLYEDNAGGLHIVATWRSNGEPEFRIYHNLQLALPHARFADDAATIVIGWDEINWPGIDIDCDASIIDHPETQHIATYDVATGRYTVIPGSRIGANGYEYVSKRG